MVCSNEGSPLIPGSHDKSNSQPTNNRSLYFLMFGILNAGTDIIVTTKLTNSDFKSSAIVSCLCLRTLALLGYGYKYYTSQKDDTLTRLHFFIALASGVTMGIATAIQTPNIYIPAVALVVDFAQLSLCTPFVQKLVINKDHEEVPEIITEEEYRKAINSQTHLRDPTDKESVDSYYRTLMIRFLQKMNTESRANRILTPEDIYKLEHDITIIYKYNGWDMNKLPKVVLKERLSDEE